MAKEKTKEIVEDAANGIPSKVETPKEVSSSSGKIEQVSENTEDVKPVGRKITSIDDALKELRKEENKRKFVQTVDLVINLQNFDVRKEALNTFITIPHPSEKKIAAFLTKKSELVDTITEGGFVKYKDTKDIKKLSKQYSQRFPTSGNAKNPNPIFQNLTCILRQALGLARKFGGIWDKH